MRHPFIPALTTAGLAGLASAGEPSTWVSEQELMAKGHAVAVSGDTAVVGVPGAAASLGFAWVYERNGSGWAQEALLRPADIDAGDRFGWSVAVDGDVVVVGSTWDDLNARWTEKPGQNPGVGALTQIQLWYRDPQSTSNRTTSLSDALEACVGP